MCWRSWRPPPLLVQPLAPRDHSPPSPPTHLAFAVLTGDAQWIFRLPVSRGPRVFSDDSGLKRRASAGNAVLLNFM